MNTEVYGVTSRSILWREVVESNARRGVAVSLGKRRPNRFPSVLLQPRLPSVLDGVSLQQLTSKRRHVAVRNCVRSSNLVRPLIAFQHGRLRASRRSHAENAPGAATPMEARMSSAPVAATCDFNWSQGIDAGLVAAEVTVKAAVAKPHPTSTWGGRVVGRRGSRPRAKSGGLPRRRVDPNRV